jgi:O-antigen/teichoic acid export membrane protein
MRLRKASTTGFYKNQLQCRLAACKKRCYDRIGMTGGQEQDASEAAPVTSKDVAKGAGTTLLARLGGVIDVIAQPLYVWLFGLAGFGLYSVLWAAVNMIENVADLGMTSALQRTIPQAKTETEAVSSLRTAMVLGVGPCLAIAAIICAFATPLSHVFNAAASDEAQLAHAIALFVWALPLWAFVEIATSALRARRVFGAEVRLRLFWEQVARLLISVLFWLAGFGTMAIFYAHLASLSIICLLCIRLMAQHYDLSLFFTRSHNKAIRHDTLKAGLAVLPANIVARLFGDAPILALNLLLPGAQGAVASGLFAIARKISSIVQLVRTAFAYVLAPLASLASTGSKASVRDIYGFATRVSLAVALPLGAGLAALGPSLLSIFGKGAHIALPGLVILIAARIAEAVFGAAVPIQQVIAGYKSQLVGSIVGFGLAVLLVWVLLPGAGLTGMTIAVGVGLVVAATIPVWQLFRYDDLHPFEAPFLRVGGKAMFVAAAGLLVALPTNLLIGMRLLPDALLIPIATIVMLAVLLGTIWCACRFALPLHDREALGKTGRALRLA